MATTDEPVDPVPPTEEPVEEGDVRPSVKKYSSRSEFRLGDAVYYINDYGEREGPYLVAQPLSSGKCTLCDLNGTPVKGSRSVSLSSLEKYRKR